MDSLLQHVLYATFKQTGSYDPDECLYAVEESMTLDQYETASAFLRWVHDNDKAFGHNLPTVYAEYERSK
jgi:hypothetical protein